jgi:dTDP-glucose 4,6-dehydratase
VQIVCAREIELKALVTGGLGFIGSNFILELLKTYPNSKITNVDAKLSGSNVKNLQQVSKNKNYKFVYGNITNQKLVDKLVSTSDVVFNFAAESHVDRSISNPRPFIESNIIGVYTILEAIRKYEKRLIQISTDEVYGSLKKGSADESYNLNPSSPYSSSKASAELLVNSYHVTYGVDALITRCTNNYGPRQHPEKLIPKVIMLAKANKRIPIYGSGKQIRDWVFVTDHCRAVLNVYEKGKSGQSYNIAGHNELDNNTIVRKILKIMNKPLDLIDHVRDRPGHDFRYSMDSSKIEKQLKWEPLYDFETGLRDTISWYMKN